VNFLNFLKLLFKDQCMKWRNYFAAVVGSMAACLITSNAQAQSAFAGFYGQVSTGYEGNQLGGMNGTVTNNPNTNTNVGFTAPSQNFGGVPLVLGAGYYWQASEKWLIGVGADYSVLSQTSSNWTNNVYNLPGSNLIAPDATLTGSGLSKKLSNRFNFFLTPAYAIDKDKLVYLKAGYSQVSAQFNRATTATGTLNGVSNTVAAVGGSMTSTQGGYLLGLGYKQIITGGFYGFIEGNYMSYSAPSYTFGTQKQVKTALGVTPSSSISSSTTGPNSLNSYQFLLGVGYAF
jgi:hypothetical protein